MKNLKFNVKIFLVVNFETNLVILAVVFVGIFYSLH